MTWRDGVHLTGTSIWCDARRRRDLCFTSSADRLVRGTHGQLIGTPTTLALLGARGDGHLAVPLRQRFTLGTLRLELIPSGRGVGAAALFVDGAGLVGAAAGITPRAGRRILYAGAVRTISGGAGDPAEVRDCDALVVAAPYGEAHHVFPPLGEVIDAALVWTRACLTADRRPVLFVDTALDGLEVAMRLATEGVAIAAARPIREAALRAGTLVATPAIGTPGKEPRAVIWLDSDHAGLIRALAGRSFATALVSGRALDGATGYDAAFAWAHAADRSHLLAWIASAGARDVFVTGACAEVIATTLGPHARVLGPPEQMALFAT